MKRLHWRATDCYLGQELAYVCFAMQNLFTVFFIAFERFVASKRASTYAIARHGHRFGVGSIAASCLLTGSFLVSVVFMADGVQNCSLRWAFFNDTSPPTLRNV